MYFVTRPFNGRVRDGAIEYGGFYTWAAYPNDKYARDFSGTKMMAKSEDEKDSKMAKNVSPSLAVAGSQYAGSHDRAPSSLAEFSKREPLKAGLSK